MRSITSILAAGLLACSMTAIAADDRGGDTSAATDTNTNVVRAGPSNTQFGDECAWGLANGQHVKTNCSINMTGSDGKTYCFSSDQAMANFMKSPSVNLTKATDNFGRS